VTMCTHGGPTSGQCEKPKRQVAIWNNWCESRVHHKQTLKGWLLIINLHRLHQHPSLGSFQF
jgi:hypothetical protein